MSAINIVSCPKCNVEYSLYEQRRSIDINRMCKHCFDKERLIKPGDGDE